VTDLTDREMWREIAKNDIDKWGFDALVAMAKRMLDEVYPETVFNRESVGVARVADLITGHVGVTRNLEGDVSITGVEDAAHAIVDLMHRNSGVRFVVLLRTLIDEIETRP